MPSPKRRLRAAALALLLPGLAAASGAAGEDGAGAGGGISFVAGGSFGVPSGRLAGETGVKLGTLVRDRLAARLELGLRFSDHVEGVLLGEVGSASPTRTACPGGCEAWSATAGLGLRLHLRPGARVDPWLSVGGALELLRFDDGSDGGALRSYTGFAGTAEAGLDLRLGDTTALGPFLSGVYGPFTRSSGVSESPRIPARASHAWLSAGLRFSVIL